MRSGERMGRVSVVGRAYAVDMPGVEFDLHGERVSLDEGDLNWLLEQAKPRTGSSSALGELVTMLELSRGGPRPKRGPVVLQRADSRALRTLLLDHAPPSACLERLRALLGLP
jgi:hypothetical protein